MRAELPVFLGNKRFILRGNSMNIELGNGNWYINGRQCDDIIGLDLAHESETNKITYISPIFSANEDMSFECNATINNNLLQQLCYPPVQNPHSLEAYVPIMIQARWHKKPRIRKKWLKRYGVKPDEVKLNIHINSMSITPLDGYEIQTEFKADDIQYELRPDQKRKGILWYITY